MKSSSYLNWFRRLVVLGAVVAAGASASTAGAVGRPPDIQDVATRIPAADVSRPPDIRRVAARLSASVPDVFERYAADSPVRQRERARRLRALRRRSSPVRQRAVRVRRGRSAGRPTSSMRPPRPNSRSTTSSSGTPPSIRSVARLTVTPTQPRLTAARCHRQSSGAAEQLLEPVERLQLERLGDRDRHRDGAGSHPRHRAPDEQATAPPRAACLGSPPRTDRAGPTGPARSAEVGSSGLV